MNKNNPTDPTMNTFTTEKTYTLYDICVENVGGWREGVLRFNEYLTRGRNAGLHQRQVGRQINQRRNENGF
jgi:hypothetical protein